MRKAVTYLLSPILRATVHSVECLGSNRTPPAGSMANEEYSAA